jgi:hypothetical protein
MAYAQSTKGVYSLGGAGGGGNGGSYDNSTNYTKIDIQGYPNTGGGGGAYGGADTNTGGTGGSGIVIIRYPSYLAPATSTTGSPQTYIAGAWRVYVFTASGTITF